MEKFKNNFKVMLQNRRFYSATSFFYQVFKFSPIDKRHISLIIFSIMGLLQQPLYFFANFLLNLYIPIPISIKSYKIRTYK